MSNCSSSPAAITGALFDTPIGRCGIAWQDEAIRAVALPDGTDAKTLVALRRACGGDLDEGRPSAAIDEAVARISALLGGADVAFDDIQLDFGRATAFERAVYAETVKIRQGWTKTYGEIAVVLGDAKLARAVGRALGGNPIPIIMPCHRVVAANGKLGGFSASGGRGVKRLLLDIEQARMPGGPTLFDAARKPQQPASAAT